jgi:hypothetical protein
MPVYVGPAWLLIKQTGIGGTFADMTEYLVGATGTRPSFQQMLLQRGTADIPLRVLAGDTYAPERGQQVLLLDQTVTQGSGQLIVFAGKIQRVETTWDGSAGDRLYHCSCVSLEACLDEVRVPPTPPASYGSSSWGFAGVSCGQIVATLFNTLMTGSPISLPSGTGPLYGLSAGNIVVSLDFNTWPRLSEVISQLATLSEFVWGVNPQTQQLYFNLPNTTPAPFSLATSQMQWESMKWESNLQDYRNRQILQIQAAAFAQSSELFQFPGGSGIPYFNLMRPPAQVTFAWLTQNIQAAALITFSGNPSNGDTFTIGYPAAGSIYNPQYDFPYVVGQVVIDPAGHSQIVTSAGTSGLIGAGPPSWNDTGGQTAWGSVEFQDQGVQFGGAYKFVSALDNTQWGQILIGANVSATMQNFIDAINANQAVAGATFSWPTWENPLLNASIHSGTQILVVNKPAGAGYSATLATTSGVISAPSATSGGGDIGSTYSLTVAQNGQSSTANLYYTPGQTQVALASTPSGAPSYPPNNTWYLQVQYTRDAGDMIVCEATGQIAAMKLIDHGTGEYQQFSSDTNQPSNAAGLAECQAELAAYGGLTAVPAIPIQFTFDTLVGGLIPGAYLTIALDSTAPAFMAALANGNYAVQEVRGELVPTGGEGTYIGAPGAGHFRYTVTVINVAEIGTWLDFWQGLASGGTGGGGAGLIGSNSSGGALGVAGQFIARIILPGTQPVATDVLANRYVVEQNVTLGSVTISAKAAPSTAAFIADILVSTNNGSTWTTIFPTLKPTLPVSSNAVVLNPSFAIASLAIGNMIRVDVLQSDGASGIEIDLIGSTI